MRAAVAVWCWCVSAGVALAADRVPTPPAAAPVVLSRPAATAPAPGAPTPAVKPSLFEDEPAPQPKAARIRPLVVIDPGHGGIDPGAVGAGKTTEKAVVLAVARALRTTLVQSGRYDVVLTRDGDVFVPLDRRVEISRQAMADVFISLHADAIDERAMAKSIKGASIYTLSEKASDEQARTMAEKENAADLVAGIVSIPAEGDEGLKSILFDLMARETQGLSTLLSRSLVAGLSKAVHLAREPERAAAFRVLKQAHAPSVLIELGFLSHAADEARLASPEWQRQASGAIAAAIDLYFVRKSAHAATPSPGAVAGGLPP